MKTWADFGITIKEYGTNEQKTVCPQCSHTRKKSTYPCLNVNLDKGVWHCWHCDFSGSLARGEDHRAPLPVAPRVFRKPVYHQTELPARVIEWFASRGIPETVLARRQIGYGLVYMPQLEQEVSAIQFPYFRQGEVVNCKYRDGHKHFRMAAGAERILYGLDDITGETLLICEGEPDAMALEVAGYSSVVSVPDGAPAVTAKNYETKFDFLLSAEEVLRPLKRIIVAVDNDAPGEKLAEELARRLGPERCYRVQWSSGCKDANEVLISHGAAVVRECVEAAQPWPVSGVVSANMLASSLAHIYTAGMERGLDPGWPILAKYYTVRAGEMTIVTGIPSHGKSAWLSALVINMARLHQWCFTIFSPENYPLERYAASLLEQYLGMPFDGEGRMTKEEMEASLQWLNAHISFLMPEDDSPTIDALLTLASIQVYRQGIKGLVLDPWNEIEHSRPAGQTETEYISHALTQIRRFARHHGVHVWVIAHPTKMRKAETGDYQGQYPPPTPYDISGCHAADTDVLTMRGWIAHAEVTLQDEVACFDPYTETLRYEHPTKAWQGYYQGAMYHFKGRSFDALVTPNHRMVMKPQWRHKHIPIGNGLGRPFRYSRTAWSFVRAEDFTGEMDMPWATPCEGGSYQETILGYPAEGFLMFLGWWLSEGWLNKVSKGLGVCQGIGTLADKIRMVMHETGIHFTEKVGAPGTGGSIPGWKAYIGVRANRALCAWIPAHCGHGASQKRIPEFVWTLPAAQKAILLQALIEGDGRQKRGDTFEYSTTSLQLANDVQRLAIECGRMSSRYDLGRALPWHANRYAVTIGRIDRHQIGVRAARHVEKVDYDGMVYCLTVPTGAYLVRRNGKPGIYGNSAHFRNKADNCVTIWRNVDANDNRVQVHIQKIRFREIGKPGGVTLVYNPHCGQFTEPVQEVSRWSA